jgi:hypothetical protein
MATYSVKDFIGKNLLIDKVSDAWWGSPGNTNFASFQINPGEQVVIDTYVTSGDNIWFGILDDNKAADQGYQNPSGGVNEYFIQYSDGLFDQAQLQASGVQSSQEKADQLKKDQQSGFQYYVERWGPWVLGTGVVIALGKAYANRKKANG